MSKVGQSAFKIGSLVTFWRGNKLKEDNKLLAVVVRLKSTMAPGHQYGDGCSDEYMDIYVLQDKSVGWLQRAECELIV